MSLPGWSYKFLRNFKEVIILYTTYKAIKASSLAERK